MIANPLIPKVTTVEEPTRESVVVRKRTKVLLRAALWLLLIAMLGDVVMQCVIPSFTARKADFTEVYAGSLLLPHYMWLVCGLVVVLMVAMVRTQRLKFG